MPLEWIHTASIKLFFSRSSAHAVATYCLKDPFEEWQPLTSNSHPPPHRSNPSGASCLPELLPWQPGNSVQCYKRLLVHHEDDWPVSLCPHRLPGFCILSSFTCSLWNASHHTPHYTLPPFTLLPKAKTSSGGLTPLLRNGPTSIHQMLRIVRTVSFCTHSRLSVKRVKVIAVNDAWRSGFVPKENKWIFWYFSLVMYIS